jgi:hypothetical protein
MDRRWIALLALANIELAQPNEPQATDPPAPPAAREASQTPREQELARAHWVEGRVILPPGTPADEELHVVADGKDFADGSDHRARLGPDGSFRVAFSEKSRSGKIGIEARYLYLDEAVRWKRGRATPIVLRPELGARLVVRLVPPAGIDPGSIDGRVQLSPVGLDGGREDDDQLYQYIVARPVRVGIDLVHAYGGLRPGYRYDLTYAGDDLASAFQSVELEAGDSRSQELELVHGATLSGRVVNGAGAPLAGAHVYANSEGDLRGRSRHRGTVTPADGSFELRALSPGRVRLYAERGGYDEAELDLGALAGREARTELVLVLAPVRGISGRVVFPDGQPASAVVSAISEPSKGPGHRVSTCSASDGRFRLTGLPEEAYAVMAYIEWPSGNEQLPRWQGHVEDVSAGTEGLLLTLSEGEELELRVLDENGSPVTECALQGRWVTRRREVQGIPGLHFRSRRESLDGSYRVEGLLAGEWEIGVTAGGFGPCPARTVAVPTDRTLTFVLPSSR